MAGFCLWGGCFILGAAIATRILDMHGTLLALALVVIASVATWLLLPNPPSTGDRFIQDK
ncbi:MAG: hypothetical protein ACLPM3_12545 [Terracidiphilus sp.]